MADRSFEIRDASKAANMRTRTAFPIPTCPTCGLPMILDAAEMTPAGITKTIFHCKICRTEIDRITKTNDGTQRQSRYLSRSTQNHDGHGCLEDCRTQVPAVARMYGGRGRV